MNLTPLHIKIGLIAAASSVVLLAMSALYYTGHSRGVISGRAAITVEWQKEKIEHRDKILMLTAQIQQKEFAHRQESSRVAEQLRKTEVQYEEATRALSAERTQRLLLSKERAAVYQRLANAGSDKCRDLASHAAKLDHSLEEGRGLVAELQTALGQRDEQLRLLGAQLINDRRLLDKQ